MRLRSRRGSEATAGHKLVARDQDGHEGAAAHGLVSGEYGEGWQELADAVDEACLPALEDAVAPHVPAIRAALRDLDTAGRPSAAEIIERMSLDGSKDPDTPT